MRNIKEYKDLALAAHQMADASEAEKAAGNERRSMQPVMLAALIPALAASFPCEYMAGKKAEKFETTLTAWGEGTLDGKEKSAAINSALHYLCGFPVQQVENRRKQHPGIHSVAVQLGWLVKTAVAISGLIPSVKLTADNRNSVLVTTSNAKGKKLAEELSGIFQNDKDFSSFKAKCDAVVAKGVAKGIVPAAESREGKAGTGRTQAGKTVEAAKLAENASEAQLILATRDVIRRVLEPGADTAGWTEAVYDTLAELVKAGEELLAMTGHKEVTPPNGE